MPHYTKSKEFVKYRSFVTFYKSCKIQVWNSKTNKLVHKYSLHTDESKWGKGTERALDVRDMTVLNGVIWFIGSGLQRSLIRLDCKTFEMRHIELEWNKSQEAAIYKLDYKNQTVYEYDKDGNCKELTWIEGLKLVVYLATEIFFLL